MTATTDEHLPFILRRDNVARYENGVVTIGDRRQYPFARTFVHCRTVDAVAQAIEQMVTQGGGPWVAAAYALVLAAHESEGKSAEQTRQDLEAARDRLVATRPTNTSLARVLERLLHVALQTIEEGTDVVGALIESIERMRDKFYRQTAAMAKHGCSLIADGDGILTMCFAEVSFLLSLSLAHKAGKQIHVYVPETRPYLQGARLTAPSVHELGIPVTVVTDNMPAYLMAERRVQKFMTASDLVTMDGHVVNKIGTFQLALAAHAHGIPYFAYTLSPDPNHPTRTTIVIEEREPQEVLGFQGTATTADTVPGYYPAFDITPPHLVAGLVTEHGVLSPYSLPHYYESR